MSAITQPRRVTVMIMYLVGYLYYERYLWLGVCVFWFAWLDMLLQSNLVAEDLANEAVMSTTAWHNAVNQSVLTALIMSYPASSICLTTHPQGFAGCCCLSFGGWSTMMSRLESVTLDAGDVAALWLATLASFPWRWVDRSRNDGVGVSRDEGGEDGSRDNGNDNFRDKGNMVSW